MRTSVMKVIGLLFLLGSVAFAQPPDDQAGGGPPVDAPGQVHVAEVLRDRSVNWQDARQREQAIARLREVEDIRRTRAHEQADALGIPRRRVLPDGTIEEIVGLDEDGAFLIYTTHNVNAAISTGADALQIAPYSLDGTDVTVGVWDGGAVRNTHQEFQTSSGSRVTIMDGSDLSDHGTHVGGTIGAAGISPSRRGMATNVWIDSYDWNNDTSDMASRGATGPGQETQIHISNHSYGFVTGWRRNGSVWEWTGQGTDQNAVARQFGQYTAQAENWDGIAYNAPYYLIFKSAGNDNNNNPSVGSQVVIDGDTVTYDPAIHPPGDGLYRNPTGNVEDGYANISHAGNAKNVMTVGAANAAVSAGERDPAQSTLANFSSRGPSDDGRIKPDIVANGVGLSSTGASSDTHYYGSSGTSMSSPNAAGSAALLVQLYGDLFPGSAMRASTLKGLLIHTATDLGAFGLGNPGPDYHYGWGLINVQKAADLILDHHTDPSKQRIREHALSTSVPSRSYTFTWDGLSPIRATLSWTDPPGQATTALENRTPRLVNDLDLKLIAPDGTEYLPFVMPFVGDWSVEAMAEPATTGTNHVDNVEQVLIEDPLQEGTWEVKITHKGSLTNGEQVYSLLLSGMAGDPDLLVLQSISPSVATVGDTVTMDILGNALSEDTVVLLQKDGQPDVPGTDVQMVGNALQCSFDLSGVTSAGKWDVVATNPDEQTFTLQAAFTIHPETIWAEHFDASSSLPSGWTSSGDGEWSVVDSSSHTPDNSVFIPNYNFTTLTYLTSPVIEIPAGVSDMQFVFWHAYDLETVFDGGVLEFSVDGGDWLDVEDAGSGLSFSRNGYTHTLSEAYDNPLGGRTAWSGNSGGYVQTVVDIEDTAMYAGHSIQVRWGLGTDEIIGAPGWYVDTVSLRGIVETPQEGFLAVSPVDAFVSFGTEGGPFAPSSLTYTLQNVGLEPLDWEVSNTEGWVSLSTPTGGTLAAGDSTTVTASIHSSAESLDLGTYGDTISFVNTTNGDGDSTRAVSLSVLGPGTLEITPADDFLSSGFEGGPFSPSYQTYTLTNPGGDSIDWEASKSAPWFDLSATSGTLAPEASVSVTITLNSEADVLAFGTYDDTISFVNTTNGNGNDTRDVEVTVLELIPDVPTGLTATAFTDRVELDWDAAARAASYHIKRADDAGGPYTTIDTTTTTSFSDDTVTDVQTYYYVVSAVNTGGESADSVEVEAVVRHAIPFVDDFEALEPGALAGQNGWEASGAFVEDGNTQSGNQAVRIEDGENYVRQVFGDEQTHVWTDYYYQPAFFENPPTAVDADATVIFFFDENGNPVVYNGETPETISEVSITPGEWVRVTVESDYATGTWNLYIDASRVASGLGFYNESVTNYTSFAVRGGGSTGAYLDDVQVLLESPLEEDPPVEPSTDGSIIRWR